MAKAGGAAPRRHRAGLCTLGAGAGGGGVPAPRGGTPILRGTPCTTASRGDTPPPGLSAPDEAWTARPREVVVGTRHRAARRGPRPPPGGERGQRVRSRPGSGGRLADRKRPGAVAVDWQRPAPMERRRRPRRLRTARATGPSQPGAGAPPPAPLPVPRFPASSRLLFPGSAERHGEIAAAPRRKVGNRSPVLTPRGTRLRRRPDAAVRGARLRAGYRRRAGKSGFPPPHPPPPTPRLFAAPTGKAGAGGRGDACACVRVRVPSRSSWQGFALPLPPA